MLKTVIRKAIDKNFSGWRLMTRRDRVILACLVVYMILSPAIWLGVAALWPR